ncbi:MAG TPA: transglycosylase SLT domain-containing protein [Gammaproteobacteria bacterium]|nr:transglycosylase SLT domain-containing protein [Gammaproteobacteria bacterium]
MSTAALAGAPARPPQLERQAFVAAERALAAGDTATFERLAATLRDYPLYPYLVFDRLEQELDGAKAARIKAFLDRYADTPLAPRLQRDWLDTLARRRQWKQFLAAYVPGTGETLRCDYARALLEQMQQDKAGPVVRSLWLVGRSRPKSCDPVFRAWREAGNLTPDLVWERIHLAMQAGQSGLAGYLARYLPQAQRGQVTLWRQIRREPQRVLTEPGLLAAAATPNGLAGWILSDGLRRLAHADPQRAAAFWQTHGASAPVTKIERAAIERTIALELADAGDAGAAHWIQRIKDPAALRRLRTTHIVAALREGEWEQALTWIDALAPERRQSARWRYWRARALEAMGRKAPAKALYKSLAAERGYYGFLAADRAGTAYRFDERPLVYRAEELREVADLPGIQRARELFHIGHVVDARREWRTVLPTLSEPQLLKAAQLAHQWGWHDRAIFTLGRARYWDDLKLRFPLAYQDEVVSEAASHDIDPAWAFAVIRQESAFTPDAHSSAGAMGLMQLLPRTARQMARTLQVHLGNRSALLDAGTNIRLGVRYLKRVEDRFGGHTVLATAAYNAGARRVRAWQPQSGPMAADVWVETVPYAETRNYLRRVMAYTVIYQQRLGYSPEPLQQRMQTVPPVADDAGTEL